MVLKIQCSCGKTLKIPERLRGKQGRCPTCATIISVPVEAGAVEPLEQANEPQTSFSPQDLFEHVIDSVVGIAQERGYGSGVFVDSSGIIATNRHVVGSNRQVIVNLNDGREHQGSDESSDQARKEHGSKIWDQHQELEKYRAGGPHHGSDQAADSPNGDDPWM